MIGFRSGNHLVSTKGTMTESPIRTVVIAEDDQATKDGLEMSLEIEGYRVLTASDGKAALALLPHLKPPCLLLLDLLMPEMTGFELLERKNLDPSIAWIPVVVLSGMENQHLAGVAAFVNKPYQLDRVLKAIQLHISPEGPQSQVN